MTMPETTEAILKRGRIMGLQEAAEAARRLGDHFWHSAKESVKKKDHHHVTEEIKARAQVLHEYAADLEVQVAKASL